jgi:hypothetical protein
MKAFNTDYFVGNKPEHSPSGNSGGYSSGSGDPLQAGYRTIEQTTQTWTSKLFKSPLIENPQRVRFAEGPKFADLRFA